MSADELGGLSSEVKMLPVAIPGPVIQSFQSQGLTKDGAESLVNGNLPSNPVDKLQVGNAVQSAASRSKGVLGVEGGKKLVDWRAKSFGQGSSAAGFTARTPDRVTHQSHGDLAKAGLAAMQLSHRKILGGSSSAMRGTQAGASGRSGATGVVALGSRGPYTIGGAAAPPAQPSVGIAAAILGKMF